MYLYDKNIILLLKSGSLKWLAIGAHKIAVVFEQDGAVCGMISMGESFQDYSWIQDFEADFP